MWLMVNFAGQEGKNSKTSVLTLSRSACVEQRAVVQVKNDKKERYQMVAVFVV